jgi:hypothetical protein
MVFASAAAFRSGVPFQFNAVCSGRLKPNGRSPDQAGAGYVEAAITGHARAVDCGWTRRWQLAILPPYAIADNPLRIPS